MRTPRGRQRLVIAAGYLLGAAAVYRGLPAPVPPSWGASGQDTIWLGAPLVAFLLPTFALLTDNLLRGLCLRHPVAGARAADVLAVYDAIMLRLTIFIMGVHAAVLVAVLGLVAGRAWAAQLVPVMLGLMLIGIGNLLPRTLPNLAIGIRTSRTLADRALWRRVHRTVGYLVVASGTVIVVSALAVPRPLGPGMILLVGPAMLVGTGLVIRRSRAEHAGA
jgi:uncharacterized membrane protein